MLPSFENSSKSSKNHAVLLNTFSNSSNSSCNNSAWWHSIYCTAPVLSGQSPFYYQQTANPKAIQDPRPWWHNSAKSIPRLSNITSNALQKAHVDGIVTANSQNKNSLPLFAPCLKAQSSITSFFCNKPFKVSIFTQIV